MNIIDIYQDITFWFLYSPSLYIHIIPIKYLPLQLTKLECTLKATHTYTKAAVATYVA